jgi:hypothetical protein
MKAVFDPTGGMIFKEDLRRSRERARTLFRRRPGETAVEEPQPPGGMFEGSDETGNLFLGVVVSRVTKEGDGDGGVNGLNGLGHRLGLNILFVVLEKNQVVMNPTATGGGDGLGAVAVMGGKGAIDPSQYPEELAGLGQVTDHQDLHAASWGRLTVPWR